MRSLKYTHVANFYNVYTEWKKLAKLRKKLSVMVVNANFLYLPKILQNFWKFCKVLVSFAKLLFQNEKKFTKKF